MLYYVRLNCCNNPLIPILILIIILHFHYLIYTGLTTVLSGYFSGPPILISPESAAGIKAGAKTGVSTLVCGCLFGIATFFYPVFAAVPAAGTAPLLIMVGVMLFANVKVRYVLY